MSVKVKGKENLQAINFRPTVDFLGRERSKEKTGELSCLVYVSGYSIQINI